jgi:cytochrome c-type biogenesis protein
VTALALAFVAGVLSILSPCVLPLVPIVLGAAVSAHPLGAFALAAGLALSFTGIGLSLALVGFGIDIDAGTLRLIAATIMVALGAVLMLPSWQARLAAAGGPVSAWADRHFGSVASSGLAGQLAIGLLLGAVWSPCVGPTLGAASLLASQGQDLPRVTLTIGEFRCRSGIATGSVRTVFTGELDAHSRWPDVGGKTRQGPARGGLHRDGRCDRQRCRQAR